jgi:Tfp pilus assembly protein PilF
MFRQGISKMPLDLISKFKNPLSATPKLFPKSKLAQAIATERVGDPASAAKAIDALVREFPKDGKVLDAAGRFHYRRGALERAIGLLVKARAVSNNNLGCSSTLAASYQRNGNLEAYAGLMGELQAQATLKPKEHIILAEHLIQSVDSRKEALSHFDEGLERVANPEKYEERYGRFLMKFAAAEMRAKGDLGNAKMLYERGMSRIADREKYQKSFGKIRAAYGHALAKNPSKLAEAKAELEAARNLVDNASAINKTLDAIGRKLSPSKNAAKKMEAASPAKAAMEENPSKAKSPAMSAVPSAWTSPAVDGAKPIATKSRVERTVVDLPNRVKGPALLKEAMGAAKIADQQEQAKGLFEAAIDELGNHEKASSGYALVLTRLAQGFTGGGDIDKGIAYFEKAVALAPSNYNVLARYGAFLVKAEYFERANFVLQQAEAMATTQVAHLAQLGAALTRLGDHKGSYEYLKRALEVDDAKKVMVLTRLADVATALGLFENAVAHLQAINDLDGNERENTKRDRIIHLLNLRRGVYSPQDQERLAVCKTFFDKNTPKLDEEQQRILDELVDKGICMSDFDSLFGKKDQNLWNAAEAHVKSFTEDPDVRALEKRISECDDFNADPEFSKSFKPSIVNYRMVKGEMYAIEAAYQFYLNKRILDIANSYNEMLSKIRNVALWLNPPIGGKNVGERKGSQIWHRDQEDENILKCFIYYTDVEEGCGPTEYIPYSKVNPTRKYSGVLPYPASSGYPGAYLIDTVIDPADMMSATGRKKSIMFFDTNGFHRGGYVTASRRILTMATFLRPVTPYADTNTKLSTKGWDSENKRFEVVYGLQN